MSETRGAGARWRRMTAGTAGTVAKWTLGGLAALAVAGYAVFAWAAWPTVLLTRLSHDGTARKLATALEKHVPTGVTVRLAEQYDLADDDAYLDVFYPTELESTGRTPTTVVWVHGGWVAGRREHVASYLKVLAGRGFAAVAVGYSVAPGSAYPAPLRQVNAALSYLEKNARRLHVNPGRIVLAGDSSGAHIAAQLANVISVPAYAKAVGVAPAIQRAQLKGVMLYGGAYDLEQIHLGDHYSRMLKTLVTLYMGTDHDLDNPRLPQASVIAHVTPAYPPVFVAAGSVDPLASQSRAFADAVARGGVHVDRLFFPDQNKPAVPPQFQFNLDSDAGTLALERSVRFLAER